MSYHIGLQVLRAKVRGLQAAGITLHSRLRKAKGSKRNELWNEKRRLGCYSREHLIAYGLLRGIHYGRIERCAKENKPDVSRVFELMKAHADWKQAHELTIDKVQELLTPADSSQSPLPTSQQPVAPNEMPMLEERLLVKPHRLLEKRA